MKALTEHNRNGVGSTIAFLIILSAIVIICLKWFNY
jgi:hypothetical protein